VFKLKYGIANTCTHKVNNADLESSFIHICCAYLEQ